ncbi:MAG: signal peptidase I, partial [Actinomycetota bacterium]|nr:signal peptidase I [Actinomycetota bacterium]
MSTPSSPGTDGADFGPAPAGQRDVPLAGATGSRDVSSGAGQPADTARAGGATAAPERAAGRARNTRRRGSFLGELPVLVLVALVLSMLLKAFVVQAFYIPSGSMENTLRIGDRVLVNKLVYRVRDIDRGEIVVFNGLDSFTSEVQVAPATNPLARVARAFGSALGVAPPGEKDFIKRVVGIPGDRVRCCDAKGRVSVNGVPLHEPYLFPGDSPSETTFDVTVPAGRLWVMGDHRSHSADSRAHLGDPGGGTVPADKVIGRAFVVVWPFERAKGLRVPVTYEQDFATSRRSAGPHPGPGVPVDDHTAPPDGVAPGAGPVALAVALPVA